MRGVARSILRRTALGAAVSFLCAQFGCFQSYPLPPYEPDEIGFPLQEDSLRFAVIGDGGTGGLAQEQVGAMMAQLREQFPFDLVLMLGDNLYGSEDTDDYQEKFEEPYRPLLDEGVEFRASLGNHDEPQQRFYPDFNMEGERYYSFRPDGSNVRFFALDTTELGDEQRDWLRDELAHSEAPWKICFFHHPIYSSGRRHGSDLELRAVLEPLFVQNGVDVVFAGHDHFYERVRPQRGIAYFVSGAAGRLRRGNVDVSDLTASYFDEDRSFMLVEIFGDELHFRSISRTGQVVDAGMVRNRGIGGSRNTAASEGVPLN